MGDQDGYGSSNESPKADFPRTAALVCGTVAAIATIGDWIRTSVIEIDRELIGGALEDIGADSTSRLAEAASLAHGDEAKRRWDIIASTPHAAGPAESHRVQHDPIVRTHDNYVGDASSATSNRESDRPAAPPQGKAIGSRSSAGDGHGHGAGSGTGAALESVGRVISESKEELQEVNDDQPADPVGEAPPTGRATPSSLAFKDKARMRMSHGSGGSLHSAIRASKPSGGDILALEQASGDLAMSATTTLAPSGRQNKECLGGDTSPRSSSSAYTKPKVDKTERATSSTLSEQAPTGNTGFIDSSQHVESAAVQLTLPFQKSMKAGIPIQRVSAQSGSM